MVIRVALEFDGRTSVQKKKSLSKSDQSEADALLRYSLNRTTCDCTVDDDTNRARDCIPAAPRVFNMGKITPLKNEIHRKFSKAFKQETSGYNRSRHTANLNED